MCDAWSHVRLSGSQHPQVGVEGAGVIKGPDDGAVVCKLHAGSPDYHWIDASSGWALSRWEVGLGVRDQAGIPGIEKKIWR